MRARKRNRTPYDRVLSEGRVQIVGAADDLAIRKQILKQALGLVLLLSVGPAPVLAGTISVDGGCTLVDAITSANNDAAAGQCTDGSGADILVLPAGSTQTLATTNNVENGLPIVTTPITIQGNGSTIRRIGGINPPLFRIFQVNPTGRLILQQVTLSGGRLAAGFGGAVANLGALTVTGSTLSGNAANTAGAVASIGATATTTISNTTIADNDATGLGGGIVNFTNATLTIVNSTISGNTAPIGGGLVNFLGQGSTNLTNTTISGNTATGAGGGVLNQAGGSLRLTNCTLTRNIAGAQGGGVVNVGSLTLDSTLISGNIAPASREVFQATGSVAANNFNLFGFNNVSGVTGFIPGINDVVPAAGITPAEILEDTLADNPPGTTPPALPITQTHALIAGSPALDAVTTGCPLPATDQRGLARPSGTACDIGAYEFAAAPPSGVQFSAPTFNVAEGAGSATITVTRTGAATLPASADFAASAGATTPATPSADFTVPPATVAFAANETSKTVAIPIINDTDIEGSETLNLTLSNPVGATLGTQSTAVLTITDDDAPIGGRTAKCNGLIATKVGTAVSETIIGTAGPDVINGLGGNDKIFGAAGNDVLCGSGGNDQMNGGPGSDQCNGGGGTDTAAACEVKLNIP